MVMKYSILTLLLLTTIVGLSYGYTDVSKTLNTCDLCASSDENYYCGDSSDICITNVGNDSIKSWPQCNVGWCSGDSCNCFAECLNTIWPCSDNTLGQIILMGFYGCILAFGAKLIGDGSELLMEILDPGIIGGLILPFLSAFPDMMIIVISGAFSSDPQTQLAIGIGTLAGSSIMLLTIPTSLSLILARTDLKNDGHGPSIDNRLSAANRFSLTKTGTSVDPDTQLNAKIMIGTSLSYLIVQGIAFAYLKSPESGQKVERWFALAGFIVCFVFMALYCTYQVVSPKLQEKKIAEAKRKYLLEHTIHHFIHNLTKRKLFNNVGEQSSSTDPQSEQSPLVHEEHKKPPVDIKKFGMKWKTKALEKPEEPIVDESGKESTIQVKEDDGSDGEKEKEEHGHTINKKKIAIKSITTLLAGAVLVSVFSDPMVDVITDFGTKLKINLFFVSFIITPFCSNASELISSLIFASKKKRANSSLTYSALYGSATMNNTMCLGVFFALVFFRNLTWEYSAEVVTILFVTVVVGTMGARFTTLKTYFAPLLLSLYPFSILLVYLLETFAHWQ